MSARIIDGVALARTYREQIGSRVAELKRHGIAVRLDAVLVDGGDNSSRVYAENQAKTCQSLGIEYNLHLLPASASYADIAGRVLLLNTQDDVGAMMVHLPFPEGVDPYRVQKLIAPEKDVEGVNPANIGNVVYGRSSLAPCTALATVKMVESVIRQTTDVKAEEGFLRGLRATVVGAGDVVGKPIAVLLMRQEATVISCNKWSDRGGQELASLTRESDIVIVAAGVPGLLKKDMVRPGAIVVDVGVNRTVGPDGKTRTVGDVAFAEVSDVAGWLSPVPGGVGPVTVAMLLLNVVEAYERRLRGG